MTRMIVRLPHAVEPSLCFSGGHDRHRSPGRVFPACIVVFTVPSSRGHLLKLPSCCVVALLLNVSLTLVAVLLSFDIALARKTSLVIRFYGKGSVRNYAAKAKATPY
jgi:hypothetical protein